MHGLSPLLADAEIDVAAAPLTANDVRVWAVRTDPFSAPGRIPALAALLSDDERRVAARFRTAQLTERYVVSHALVRHATGNVLDLPPAEIRIRVDVLGRPYLADYPALDFNLSHTEGLSVVAVRRDVVGVDVERLRDNLDARAVARRVFSDAEQATLRKGVPPSQTPFFDYWTLKEAYVKAIGMGVRFDFQKISVTPGKPMSVSLQGVDDNADNWTFRLFGCNEYRLAVVAKRQSPGDIAVQLTEVDSDFVPRAALAVDPIGTTEVSVCATR